VYHLIVNPVAGSGRALSLIDRAVAAIERAGRDVVVHHTVARRHATDIVAGLPDDAIPVSCGGDGTMHEVMVGCVRRGLPLGIIPMGSGDDFSFALGIDRTAVERATDVLLAGAERLVDVGFVGDEPFVNSFGTGFDAYVAERIAVAPRLFKGLTKYLYGIVIGLRDLRNPDVEVTVDGEVVHAGPALLVTIQNGPRTGSAFMFAPEARPDDGLFEVVIAGRFGRLGTLGILPRVIQGTHLSHPRIALHRGRRITVRWSEPVASHTEGESLPRSRDFEVTMRPRSLRVIAPTVGAYPLPVRSTGRTRVDLVARA
jgi:diacylglycerol kinase (ATP)